MKVSQLTTGRTSDFEIRKRAIQRREMGEAYKKAAQYQSKKNPMLEALENLLSGKTEKELHAAEPLSREAATLAEGQSFSEQKEQQLAQPEVRREIQDLKFTEMEVMAHEQAHKAVGSSVTGPISYSYTTGPDNQHYINGGEVSINPSAGSTPQETIAILEQVKQAALAPADPSPQDLRVAASASAQIHQTKATLANENGEEYLAEQDEIEPFAGETTKIDIPERFLQIFDERDEQQQMVFGKDLENLLQVRKFNKALSNYSSHIAMVKNGYRSFDEPQFSRTA